MTQNKSIQTIIALAVAGAMLMTVSGCVSNTPATDTAVTTSIASTSFEPTETSAVATPTPTPATLEAVLTLPTPATYASLYDGTKLYSDGTRTVIRKTLGKGEQVTITGTVDPYGVTADGAYVNLHLMSVVIPATPTPAETTAAPTELTATPTSIPTPTAAPTPKPTSAPKPTAAPTTPKPTVVPVTPAPTAVPVATLSASEVESLVWTQVESARSGFTTNHSDVLSTRCRKSAERYVISHHIPNGSCESCGAITYQSNGTWGYLNHAGTAVYCATLTEGIQSIATELVTVHVPLMATTADYTEFGVGVAKIEGVTNVTPTQYYVYISCSSATGLQQQIDMGWYN